MGKPEYLGKKTCLACSAGGFGGFHLSIFRVSCRHFGFAADWENWGENDKLSEGVGGGKGKINRLPAEAVKFKNAPHLV